MLDLVRGLSATAVMLGHLRGFVFEDFGGQNTILCKFFYFATGLAQEAVMVFFVLSGYFVGGGVCKALRAGRFSWQSYATARLVRLWMVLLPALVLTLVCDLVGRHFSPDAYAGSLHSVFHSGPISGEEGFTAGSFFGNLLFLQEICVPCFGTNKPLWSLSNEFWYYILFPLGACGLANMMGPRRKVAQMLCLLVLFAFIGWLLPRRLVLFGLIWMMGVGVWWISARPTLLRIASHPLYCVITGVIFLGFLVLSNRYLTFVGRFGIGAAFALWVCSFLGACPVSAFLRRVGTALSEISYTLYVVHFPVQFLIAATFFKGHKFAFSFTGILWFVGIFLTCLGVAVLMWSIFERRTDSVRQWVLRFFQKQEGKEKLPAQIT